MSIRITCYNYEVDKIRNIINNGLNALKYPFGETCGRNCTLEEEKCKECKERFINSIEWYDLETEGVRHDVNGNWRFFPAQKMREKE